MKIIHCADLHLDSKLESNLDSAKAKERRIELLNAFDKMVSFAKNNDVKIIIIAGDLFDTPSSRQTRIKNQTAKIIRNAPQIEFLYLRGNHDKDDFFASSDDKPQNLETFGEKWKTFEYGNITVSGCELPETIPDSLYDELKLDSSKINIVTLHGQITKNTEKPDAPLINLKKLSNKNIDYLALGHIHKYESGSLDTFNNRGIWCYSGCLEGRGFDELGEKGFVLLEIDDQVKHKFVANSIRTIREVSVELDEEMDWTRIDEKIETAIKEIPSEDLVKVILKGEISENTKSEIDIESFLRSKMFYFWKIYDETKVKIDYEKYRNDVSLKGEFVRQVEAENLSDQEKANIIITGLKALDGKKEF